MSLNHDVSTPCHWNPSKRESAHRPGAPHPHSFAHGPSPPDVVARLEWLDDLMFAAIDGNATALQAAADAWQKTRDELGAEVVEDSRQQYLRCAQGIWHSLRVQPNHEPHKVFAAIEVISLLAGKVE